MTVVESLAELDGTPHAAVFPGTEPKTVRLRLDAGESVPAHTHPDRRVLLYVVDGVVELRVGDEEHELSAGDVARFDGSREVSPRAVEAATALVVLAERVDD
ncbi:cupin domain-containing protein [Halorubrum aethiopicum]|uniref:cupin domain-containing protein n=1 Tax=Halorubrum aethiopicum TaxID=1758255 RepID=UPI00082E037E|nr:cupin domain-containing protein [Halorubrum aethiopicum]